MASTAPPHGDLQPAPDEESAPPAQAAIRIRGARVHNLKNVDLDVPRDQLVVITGLSGSGKSSLAFDTLFAEGQRQYIESLSVYARQFLDQLQRPDVDLIEGLPPTISVDQRAGGHNPRSTVATITEVYDYLRLLYARVGKPYCYSCGDPIAQQTPEQILDTILALADGTKAMILAPYVRGRKGEHRETFAEIQKAGFVRVRVDGETHDIDRLPQLTKQRQHSIDAVVDRVVIRDGIRPRVAESIDHALRHSAGLVAVCYEDDGTWRDQLFSTLYACPRCKISYEELAPRTFSFNSPYGACPNCEGLGTRHQFDPDLVVPDWDLSLDDGAVAPWRKLTATQTKKHRPPLERFLAAAGATADTPWSELSEKNRDRLLHGDGKKFLGLLILLEQQLATATRATLRERLEPYRGQVVCNECAGARLRPEARAVRVADHAIHELTALAIEDAAALVDGLHFDEADAPLADPIIAQLAPRLRFLDHIGLGYLTLDRTADTLSGGESQRVRLATGLGSGLTGVCYILDEPSVGLHPRDNDRLIQALRELQQQGASVLVVEHDEAIMRHCDHLVDLGPGAGDRGGQIVAQGTLDEISGCEASLTGRYLAGEARIPPRDQPRRIRKSHQITLEGATANNLQDVTLNLPLHAFVCVTGVSGSGKSSLINTTLYRALARRLGMVCPKPGPHSSLRGVSQLDKVIQIDQSPIGRTPRSNPATYCGIFDEIRKVFTAVRQAKVRGYKVGRFSFNVKGGRCEACQGQGTKKIEMAFLADLYVPCDECRGARFNRQTLEVRYRGHSIADVLALRIEDAVDFFENHASIARVLACLRDVGLGYLQLGQPSNTLSGGEAQRIKLAAELSRGSSAHTLYLLDEPTTGLHFEDVRRLLDVLNRLVDVGNSVAVIEHNLDVIRAADWLIDLGPGSGARGGQIVATGTPTDVAAAAESATGAALAAAD